MHLIEKLNTALADRYVIDRRIGEGGMATVYLARDVRHQRKVALKVLKPDLGAVVGVERFLSEIQVTANLQHPNLLPLFDSGAVDGTLFYVMPYVEGESLRTRLDRERQLAVDNAVHLASTIAGALDYAHRQGVIHRDLKPENILLHEGEPLIADFGIALAVSNAGGSRITQTGLSLGTPQYMSPEQATGDRVIDSRTDIYSLGALTYEMLTGEPPHVGSTSQAVIARVLTEIPRPIHATRPSVPDHVEAAVHRALEKLPADRFATAKEFSEAVTGARVVPRGSSASGTTRHRWRMDAREAIAWAVAAVAVSASAYGVALGDRGDTPPTPLQFDVQLPDSVTSTPTGIPATVALAPDGSAVAFQGTTGGRTQALYLRRMNDRQVHELPGTRGALTPTFSPDGARVLFATNESRLMEVSTRDGTARVVVDSVSAGEVSSGDRDQIVMAWAGRLYAMPAAGGRRRLIAAPDSAREHRRLGFPSVLPGGKAALVTIFKGGSEVDAATLGTVSLPGGDVRELGIRGTFARYSGTGHIVYATADGQLNAVQFSARSLRASGSPFSIAPSVLVGTGGAAAFDVAHTGTIVYLRALSGNTRLVAVSRQGSERDLGSPSKQYLMPRASPDGSQIAVGVAPGLFRWALPDVWRFDIGSRTLTPITHDSLSSRPAWSPDGLRIAYIKYPLSDSTVMWRTLYGDASLLVRAPKLVSEIAMARSARLAALRVAHGTNDSDDIWLLPLNAAASPTPFLTEPYNESQPAVSPDGNLLAYIANRTGRYEVYVRPVRGPGADVQASVGGGGEPVWSRRRGELFYRDANAIVAVNLAETPRLAVHARETLFRDAYERNSPSQPSNYDVLSTGELVMVGLVPALLSDRPVILMNWQTSPR